MTPSKILLIETNDNMVALITDALVQLRTDTTGAERAHSLVEGIAHLANGKFRMIFTARDLPDSNGIDTLRHFQTITDTPIIVVSEALSQDERELLLRNGACEVLCPDPSNIDELSVLIKNAFARSFAIEEQHQRIATLTDEIVDHARTVHELECVNARLADEIRLREKAEANNSLLAAAIEHLTESVIVTDMNRKIIYVNPAFEASSGYTREEILDKEVSILSDRIVDTARLEQMNQTLRREQSWRGRVTSRSRDGSLVEEETTLCLVRNRRKEPTHVVGVMRDIGKELFLERQLLEAQKLEAVGRLAAGIAHEINTPTQYVGDNIRFLEDAFSTIDNAVNTLKSVVESASRIPELEPDATTAVRALDEADIDYFIDEIPTAIAQSQEGVRRIAEIVQAMKEFSHPGSEKKQPADLNRAIQNTTTVCRNEWKYVADVTFDLDPSIPQIRCLVGEINQVMLNLIVNAAHAIEPKHEKNGTKGTIRISTKALEDSVEIRIADTGTGIPEKIRDKIFDPFFTTKGVGKGTGQGLAIAYATIVNKHNGTLLVDSEDGEGTTFTIRLPL